MITKKDILCIYDPWGHIRCPQEDVNFSKRKNYPSTSFANQKTANARPYYWNNIHSKISRLDFGMMEI
jgi:hypothetical protein